MTEWFENKDFWQRLEPFLFHHIRSPQMTQKEVRGVIRLLKLKRGQRILDLCCGAGRHTLALARLGFQVTGVDITKKYLEEIGREAKKKGVKVKLIRQDIRRFKAHQSFDAAMNLFSSFGYFRDQKHDFQVLKNVFDSLKPGGRFLVDVMGREVLKRDYREQTVYHDDETSSYLIQNSRIKGRWDWAENRWTWISGNTQKTFTFGIRIYSGDELTQALQKAGFSQVTLYGDFRGHPYDATAERLIAVATRP